MAATVLLASVVRKPNRSQVTSPSFSFLTQVQFVQIPAKKSNGRLSSAANQTGTFLPSGVVSYSEKLVKGTTHRFSTPSQRRQCGELALRILVTPGSHFL